MAEKFTFPKVESSFTIPPPNEQAPQTVGSCVADALAKEGKQLGMDILDDVFSIGDAISQKYVSKHYKMLMMKEMQLGWPISHH